MTRSHRQPLAALLTVLCLALAGCGEADNSAPTPADEGTAEESGDRQAVEVVLRDYEFVGLPETVPPGTRFTVANEADSELHELVAFHLPADEDRSVDELAELAPEELVGTLGQPVTVLLAQPGGPQIPAVGDGTVTQPGRYAVMCFIPTGADPQEYLQAAEQTEEGPPQVEGGPPHFVHGMRAEFTVE
jgi:hypothetical protein